MPAGDQPTAVADAETQTARRWEWGFFLGFVATAFLLGCYEITDGDFYWHLKTGELIWRRGEIPAHDWYTYTNPESRWIDLHWGFQVGLFAVWSATGSAGVVLAKSCVGAAVFALVWTAARPFPAEADFGSGSNSKEAPLPANLTAVLLLPPLLLFAGRYFERPEMLSLLFLALYLKVLSDAPRRPERLWLLPLTQVAWVNVQGLFILGPLVFGAWLVGKGFERLTSSAWKHVPPADASGELRAVRRRRERRARGAIAAEPEVEAAPPPAPELASKAVLFRGAAAFALTLVSCLVNPYGIEGAMFPMVLQARIQGADREFFLNLAGEFAGPYEFVKQYGALALFRNMTTLMLMTTAFFGAASLAAAFRAGRRPWWELLLFTAFGYLAMQAGRNSNLFAVVAGWLTISNFSFVYSRTVFSSTEMRTAAASPAILRILAAVLLGGIALSAPTGVLAEARGAGPTSIIPRRFGFGLAEWHPVEAVRLLGREGMPKRVYATHLGMASLYIHDLRPEREGKVFADPRLEANSRRVLEAFLEYTRRLAAEDPAAEAILLGTVPPGEPPLSVEETPALLVDFLTLAADEPLRRALARHPHWRMVHLDVAAAVFLWDDRARKLGLQAIPLPP